MIFCDKSPFKLSRLTPSESQPDFIVYPHGFKTICEAISHLTDSKRRKHKGQTV